MQAIEEVERIRMMNVMQKGGQKIIGPHEHFSAQLPTGPKDIMWVRFRIALLLSQAMPSIRLIVTISILPESEQALQSQTQNALVRVLSILDDELKDYIDQQNINIRRNPSLFDRINAVNATSPISNFSALDNLRKIRNNIAHDSNPQKLSWEDVNCAANEAEKAMFELGILATNTNLKKGEIERSPVEKTDSTEEKYRRTITLKITRNDLPYCEYVWEYLYFEKQ